MLSPPRLSQTTQWGKHRMIPTLGGLGIQHDQWVPSTLLPDVRFFVFPTMADMRGIMRGRVSVIWWSGLQFCYLMICYAKPFAATSPHTTWHYLDACRSLHSPLSTRPCFSSQRLTLMTAPRHYPVILSLSFFSSNCWIPHTLRGTLIKRQASPLVIVRLLVYLLFSFNFCIGSSMVQ